MADLTPPAAPRPLAALAFRWRLAVIVLVGLVVFGVVLTRPALPQNLDYHQFADARYLLGVPNLLNVISNLPFAIIGILGLRRVLSKEALRPGGPFVDPRERWPFVVLFTGVGLTALGSGYYHLEPDNARLVWDRLPMTLAFVAVLDIAITERLSVKAGLWLLGPLVVLGAASVFYWEWTEQQGRGDLRVYLLVQFFPLLAIPLILLLFPPRYTGTADWFIALGWYVVAKVLEWADAPVYALGYIVSGHTLKHLAAALGAYWFLHLVETRQPLAGPAPSRT